MDYLFDTNILWRYLDQDETSHTAIKSGVDRIIQDGHKLHITPQNLIEYHGVATRAIASNGLGMSVAEADLKAKQIESLFTMLEDCPAIYSHWRRIIGEYGVVSKQVHDARLVAVMLTYGITHILTRNGADFRRYHEITVVEV